MKIKFYSPSSSPLSLPSLMIAILILLHLAVASWETLHHSGTWRFVNSRSPPLGQWVQSVANVMLIRVHSPTVGIIKQYGIYVMHIHILYT